MKNIKCQNCQEDISQKAQTCPKCGHPNKKANHLSGTEVLTGFGVVALAIWWMAGGDSNSAVSPKENVVVPKNVTLKKGGLICFTREDWESMRTSIQDQNLQQIRILVDSARCQRAISQTTVSFLDPVSGGTSMIQMPSGRVAFVFNQDISQ